MTNEELLEKVKRALGIQGEYQDETIMEYIEEILAFLTDAGIAKSNITSGLVAQGVTDLWNYGAGEGKLSDYFLKRVTQLSFQGAQCWQELILLFRIRLPVSF